MSSPEKKRAIYGWTSPPRHPPGDSFPTTPSWLPSNRHMVLVHLRIALYEPDQILLSSKIANVPGLDFAIEVSLESLVDFQETLKEACVARIKEILRHRVMGDCCINRFSISSSIHWDNTGGPRIDQSDGANSDVKSYTIEELRLQFEMIARRLYRDRLLVLMTVETSIEPESQHEDDNKAWRSMVPLTDLINQTESPSPGLDTRQNTQVGGDSLAQEETQAQHTTDATGTGTGTATSTSQQQPSATTPSLSKKKGKGKAGK